MEREIEHFDANAIVHDTAELLADINDGEVGFAGEVQAHEKLRVES